MKINPELQCKRIKNVCCLIFKIAKHYIMPFINYATRKGMRRVISFVWLMLSSAKMREKRYVTRSEMAKNEKCVV